MPVSFRLKSAVISLEFAVMLTRLTGLSFPARCRALRLGLLVGLLLLAGCAGIGPRPPEITPFGRAALLVYAGDAHQCSRKSIAEALLYLDLETGVPRTLTVRAFDERDHPLTVDAKDVVWSASSNLRVEPDRGSATVHVTLVSGDSGELEVEVSGHRGTLKARKKRD